MKRTVALVFLLISQTAISLSSDEIARYIVQWNDYYPSEKHASLLRQALGEDVTSDFPPTEDVISDYPPTDDNSPVDHNLHGCGDTIIKQFNGSIYPAKSSGDHLFEQRWVSVTVDRVERKESASSTDRSPPAHRGENTRADEQQSKKGSVPPNLVCWDVFELRNVATKKILSDFAVVVFRHQEVMTTHRHCWPYSKYYDGDKTRGREIGADGCGGTDAFDVGLDGEGGGPEGAVEPAVDRRVGCVCGDGAGMDEVENVLVSLRSSSLVKHVRRDQASVTNVSGL